jgi:hypothetical protein
VVTGSKHCWSIPASSDRHPPEEISAIIAGLCPGAEEVPSTALQRQFEQYCSQATTPLNIVVDVSCMSRPILAEVFRNLFIQASRRELVVTVMYPFAAFTPPPDDIPANEDIRPVHETFAGWPGTSGTSTALIVGLGYERQKAEGACEYFDPTETWVFVPCSPISEYDVAVLDNNKELMARAGRKERKVEYRVDKPERTFGQLVSTISSVRSRSTPLLLPFGPKLFFVISLFASFLYPEIGVWLVTGDLIDAGEDHAASGHVVAFQARLAPT